MPGGELERACDSDSLECSRFRVNPGFDPGRIVPVPAVVGVPREGWPGISERRGDPDGRNSALPILVPS